MIFGASAVSGSGFCNVHVLNVLLPENNMMWTNHLPTSLEADFRQDINGDLAGALMEHFLEGSAPLRLW